jgi:hypothetical protein
MYKNKGNSKNYGLKEKKPRTPGKEKMAEFISESILSKITEGKYWDFNQYGITEDPQLIELVENKIKNHSVEELTNRGSV